MYSFKFDIQLKKKTGKGVIHSVSVFFFNFEKDLHVNHI